ncbi:MAG: UvrD-helicase domain-containing protein [Bacteroidales bacterium]|nr:UvrD-helicase domain-containing protein [Candidatus Scybalocola fimicaballi]
MRETIVIILFALAVVGVFAWLIYKHISKKRYAKKVNQSADLLIEKIAEPIRTIVNLFVPTHIVSDEEVNAISKKFAEIFQSAKELSEAQSVTRERKESLKRFISLYNGLQSSQEQNNKFAKEIEYVDRESISAKDDFVRLMEPNHYFTHSEKENFIHKWSNLLKSIKDLYTSKNINYLSNYDIAQFINEKCRNIEKLRDDHNNDFVAIELEKNKSFFDTVLQYPLDPQQRESIVKLEDNCLVVASAGSGKTSTMMGKISYLTQRRNIPADQILTITYTRKAAGELSTRLNNKYLKCLTFHALALDIIGSVTGNKPTIAANDLFLNVFYDLIKTEGFMSAILSYVEDLQSGMSDAFDYETAAEYFSDRKKYGIQALYPDADGHIIFTKSEEEKKICHYLSHLGVRFKYEEPYPITTFTSDFRQYKPDFTIYYKDRDGKDRKLYLEHFAINKDGEVPGWFGDGQDGGWSEANRKYNQGIVWKKSLHKEKGTSLIYTSSEDFHNGKIKRKLRYLLEQAGVPINEMSDSYLYSQTVGRNKSLEKSVMNMCQAFVFLMKANERTIEWALEKAKDSERDTIVIKQIMKPISEAYQLALKNRGEIDFTDAILMATDLCNKGKWRKYEYILVDEFQDISIDRYKFLQALRGSDMSAKLYCVGDDWQSIYRFSGSDMSLFSQFSEYFGYTEECRIETTYRFKQPFIDISSKFIQSNPIQKKKKVKPLETKNISSKTEIDSIGFEDGENVYERLSLEIQKLPKDAPVYIIGRYSYDVNTLGVDHIKFDNVNQKITVMVAGRSVPFMTIHASKGLEADYVFLLNCNSGNYGFPSQISDDPVLEYVLSKADSYEYAEERRVFYVGITRAKKKTIIMYDKKKPSTFVTELFNVNPPDAQNCPVCKTGYMVRISGGVAKNGTNCTNWRCSNTFAGCPFRVRLFDN